MDSKKNRDVNGCIGKIGRLAACVVAFVAFFSPVGVSYAAVATQSGQQTKVEVKGRVVDIESRTPLAGASIVSEVITDGTVSNADGNFSIKVVPGTTITVSFMGYKSREYKITGPTNLVVELDLDGMQLEETVVTDYFERKVENFTGSAKTMTGDDLRQVSTTNIFSALSVLDPALHVMVNNEQGSNPNNIPEIVIRGTSSMNAESTVGLNAPLVVIDGVESDLADLYDLDIFEIENVTTLKDAAATALYGEQAANGVILVSRKKDFQKELKLSYNFTGGIQFADLSQYDLMNASEKLQFELESGLYDDLTGDLYKEYAAKLARVHSGVDTDWLAKPLRTAFSHNHNIGLSGEGSGLSYKFTTRYGNTNGVMKDDGRNVFGVGFVVSHDLNDKLITTIRADFSQTDVNNSRYGSFLDYANANPYDSPYDEDGNLQPYLSYNLRNPLYEATLSSFSKSKSKTLSASANVRWNVFDDLYIVGSGSLSNVDYRSDIYKSPLSNEFSTVSDSNKKGSYAISQNSSFSALGKLIANYKHDFDKEGTMFLVNAGSELRGTTDNPYLFSVVGFFNDKLSDPTFAYGYPENGSASGTSDISRGVAFVSSANFTFKNRYYVDASFRESGSSKFGANTRFAPYWSAGAGWNLHREEWLKDNPYVNTLRIRASYGSTGSINFKSYQAITTYKYISDLVGLTGMGANPITMGNTDLKWQTTNTGNIGITSTLLKERLDFNLDIYNKRTVDMITPISMPPSAGVSSVYANVGEQTNKGFELALSGVIIQSGDFYWRLGVSATTNRNQLVKIGNAMASINATNAAYTGSSPMQLFKEGESSTMIYVVRSAGIDPASGKEIFITKDGSYTYEYNPEDKVAVGDTEPALRGAITTTFAWKGLSFNANLLYSLGGYIYNSTRASRIEQIRSKYNADRRAYTDRWKKPGDVVDYLTVVGNATSYNHTDRFVEKENYLNCSAVSLNYQFSSEKLNKVGIRKLNLRISMDDVFYASTVKQERGLSYPYAKGFSFTISPTF